MSKELYVKGITNFSLLCYWCKCGELNIMGFWNQLDTKVNPSEKSVRVTSCCEKCSLIREKNYRLTTARISRHRLINWMKIFDWIIKYIPDRCFRNACSLTLWLEGNIPI
jgi:hypothetical protein